jgi:hypothetical protein
VYCKKRSNSGWWRTPIPATYIRGSTTLKGLPAKMSEASGLCGNYRLVHLVGLGVHLVE